MSASTLRMLTIFKSLQHAKLDLSRETWTSTLDQDAELEAEMVDMVCGLEETENEGPEGNGDEETGTDEEENIEGQDKVDDVVES